MADPEVWQGGFTIVKECIARISARRKIPRPRPLFATLYIYVAVAGRKRTLFRNAIIEKNVCKV